MVGFEKKIGVFRKRLMNNLYLQPVLVVPLSSLIFL